jgi:hypothetical protein
VPVRPTVHDEGREVIIGVEGPPEEAVEVKVMADPKKPSADEVAKHELYHLPYRSWCDVCVRGRGKALAHREGRQERTLPELHLDYMFVGDEGKSGETRACLVMREASSRMTMVPCKGKDAYVLDRVVAFLEEIGCLHGDVVVKSDQESSIQSLVDGLAKMKSVRGSGRLIVEHSLVGSSASNGVAERAVQSVQGQLRVIRLALEKRYRAEIPAEHSLIAWAVEFASIALNRLEVGHDGKTAYQRLKGKRVTMPGVEFGEGVLWKSDSRTGALGKLSSAWKFGVYVGVRAKSGEFIVSDKEGVWKARSIRRRPFDERWQSSNLDFAMHFPWKSEEGAAVETEVVHVRPHEIAQDPVPSEAIPRQMYIRVGDLHQYGFTSGCQGCASIIRGKPRQGHSKACRERLQDALKDSSRFQAAEERINHYLANKLEKEDQARKRSRVSAQEPEKKADENVEMQAEHRQAPPVAAEGGVCFVWFDNF